MFLPHVATDLPFGLPHVAVPYLMGLAEGAFPQWAVTCLISLSPLGLHV